MIIDRNPSLHVSCETISQKPLINFLIHILEHVEDNVFYAGIGMRQKIVFHRFYRDFRR